ncbi:MAG: PilZ domain-containing protein [Sphingomicrobium sp.]
MKPVLERDLWSQCDTQTDGSLLPRRDDRRLVELSAYVIRADKTIVDVKVVDLSYDGCSLRTLVRLTPGEDVRLSLLGRKSAVNALVRWYDSRRAGLLFLPDKPSRERSPRKADRIPVRGEASLRRSAGTSYRVATYDVTRFGCRCEIVDRPRIDECVWIKFDGLEAVEAAVCWIEGSSMGLMYKNAWHPAVFEMLLDRLNLEIAQPGALPEKPGSAEGA